jgi:hypothetical protein
VVGRILDEEREKKEREIERGRERGGGDCIMAMKI